MAAIVCDIEFIEHDLGSLADISLPLPRPEHNRTASIHPYHCSAMDAVKRFFSSPRFAVAGASNDPSKFGYKRAFSLSLSPPRWMC